MEKRQLQYKKSQISYYRFGAGTQPVVCFHGYGEDGGGFAFLEKYLENQYTFYSIELPYHGQTRWRERLNFTHTDLQQVVHDILLENNLKLHLDNSQDTDFKLMLIGFSLGGRVALSLCQAWPGTVDRLVLLAPDGLKVNFWYWLSTRTWAGNKLFAFTMKYPGWFFGFLRLLNALGFVNTSVYKFVSHYIGNKEARLRLYQRWTSLGRLKPDLKRIKSFINKNKIQVRLVYGRHDRIILPIRGEYFQKGIEEYCSVKVIESGHQVLQEKHARDIIESLTV